MSNCPNLFSIMAKDFVFGKKAGSQESHEPRLVKDVIIDNLTNFSQQIRKALLKGVSKEPTLGIGKSVFFGDLRSKYQPDDFAKGLLEATFPSWLSDRLRSQAVDALRGLDKSMALEVADDLVDCWTYGVRHYVGIRQIDDLLHSMYNKILYCAEQQGVELPMHF